MYYTMYANYIWCNDTVINNNKLKHTVTKQSQNLPQNNKNSMKLLRTT